jgi:DNA-binding transcriptional LysR family regulator
MQIKHLRAFVVLAQELHFGRAAQRLAIVQPALSAQIRLLETELGVRLFDRNRHSVALTEVGRLFLPEARATLHQSAHAADVARASGRGEIGCVRLGFVSSVLPELLPELIRTLHQRFPRIDLELKDMPGPDQVQALRNHQLDFGLMRLPASNSGIQTREVLHEKLVLALPENHPLALDECLLPARLAAFPTFVLARRYAPGFYDHLMQALNSQGVQLEIAAELGEFTTMLALISAGLGIGLLPANAARALPPKVLSKPLEMPGYRASTGLAWLDIDTPVKRNLYRVIDEMLGAPPA